MLRVGYFVLTLIFALSTGCYTVIKHPEVVDAENAEFSHEIYFSDDCGSCHQEKINNFALDNNYSPRLNYIQNNDRWHYYYQSPWWYRDIFLPLPRTNNSSPENNYLPTTSSRKRFPGANNDVGNGSSANVSSSGKSSGSSPRITTSKKSQTSNSSTNSGSGRKRREDKNIRKVNRDSKEQKSDTSESSDKKKK
jgi:hypothetical protein